MENAQHQRKWEREEVVILVVEYFKTKKLSREEISANQQKISEFLKHIEELVTGSNVPEIFRNYAGIHMQSARIQSIDPNEKYNGMQATKLQKEIVAEYLENPDNLIFEAKNIYDKYK